MKSELAGQTLNLVLDALNEVTVGLPIRGVVQTLRSKRPHTERRQNVNGKRNCGNFHREKGEPGNGRRRQMGGTVPRDRLVPPVVLMRISGGEEGGPGNLAAFLPQTQP